MVIWPERLEPCAIGNLHLNIRTIALLIGPKHKYPGSKPGAELQKIFMDFPKTSTFEFQQINSNE